MNFLLMMFATEYHMLDLSQLLLPTNFLVFQYIIINILSSTYYHCYYQQLECIIACVIPTYFLYI